MSLARQIGRRVYFISDEHGRVKIGHALDVEKRLSGLQTSCADALYVMRLIDGGEPTERWLHRRFAAAHIRGEWFRFVPDMLAVVPPDEVPVRRVVKRRLKLSLKETLAQHDDYPFINDDRLLAAYLVTAFDGEDSAAFLAWVRGRTGQPNEADQNSSAPEPLQAETKADAIPLPVASATPFQAEYSNEGDGNEVTEHKTRTLEGGAPEVAAPPPSATGGDTHGKQTGGERVEVKRTPLRPHCLNPNLCAESGREHCWSCRKALAESEAA